MANINKITDIDSANVSKINDVASANIIKVGNDYLIEPTPPVPTGYTANLSDTPANATGSLAHNGRVPGRAFDGLNSSFSGGNIFHTIQAYNWLTYDFGLGNEKQIMKYNIKGEDGPTYYSDMSPKSYTFEGSNNNVDWDILDTQTNQTSWTRNVFNEYTIINSTSYRYYRLNNMLSSWTTGENLMIGEVEMMEGTYN